MYSSHYRDDVVTFCQQRQHRYLERNCAYIVILGMMLYLHSRHDRDDDTLGFYRSSIEVGTLHSSHGRNYDIIFGTTTETTSLLREELCILVSTGMML